MILPGMEAVGGIGCRGWISTTVGLLAQVLTAAGLDQPIEGVVGVVVARLHALVAEVDGLLRVVLNVGDVPSGVIGVVQVLQLATGPTRDGRPGVIAGERG